MSEGLNTAEPILRTISKKGAPPATRIKDANSLRSIATAIWNDDDKASRDRAAIDAMFGGEPPYVQAELDDMGQSERTNLNFNEALSSAEQAEAGYYDLTNSVRELITVRTSHGNPASRPAWEAAIAEEWTRMVREWSSFEYHFQNLVSKFVRHGVSVGYFPDEIDWRFQSAGFDTFKIPRGTQANEEAVEIALVESPVRAHELYLTISKPYAARAGWNVSLARKEIIQAANSQISDSTKHYKDWEKLERDIQNNDLAFGHLNASEIKLIHAWVREFDGRISHFVTTESEEGGEEFLFSRVGRYANVQQAYTIFTYGIGNGYYHSIRGLGFKIFPHIAVSNRLRCAAVDGAISSSTAVVQPIDQTARALEDLTTTTIGPWSVLPPGLKIVERSLPNFGQNVLPVINDMAMQLQNVSGSYASRAITPDGQARTAYEIRAQQMKDAVLSAASVNLFYVPWKRLIAEMFRRSASRNYKVSDPGGELVFEFRKRLSDRGVPLEALYRVYQVDPLRAVGSGSASMRILSLDEAMGLAGSMDDIGRVNLVRDRLAARFGYDIVDRYLPAPQQAARQPIDAKLAEIENAMLRQGQQVSVIPSENHKIHADAVLNLLADVISAVREQQMPLDESLKIFQAAIPHAEQHVNRVSSDPVHAQEGALMRKAFQQIAATAQRIGDEYQAQMEREQEAAQAEQQRQVEAQQAYVRDLEQRAGQTADPRLQQQLQEHQVKLQMLLENHEVDKKIRTEKAFQEKALNDAKAASEIRKRISAEAETKVPSNSQGVSES